MPAYPNATIDLQVKKDGSIRDAVSGAYATITRTGPKYGLVDGRLIEYPANKLAAERYSSGKGWWAAIEEQRTNLLLESVVETDGGSGRNVGWTTTNGVGDTVEASMVSDGVYGTKCQRVRMVGGPTPLASAGLQLSNPTYIVASPSTTYTFSAWVKMEVANGCAPKLHLIEYQDGTWLYATAGAAIPVGAGWARYSLTITTRATTNRLFPRLTCNADFSTGDEFIFYIDAPQLEIGTGATSYIPTTTAAVTRPADVVTFPTTAMTAMAGTVSAVAQTPTNHLAHQTIYNFNHGVGNQFRLGVTAGQAQWRTRVFDSAVAERYGYVAWGTGVTSVTGSWGSEVRTYVNATKGLSGGAGTGIIGSLPATSYIGSGTVANSVYNQPIHRIAIFNTQLSDAEIATLSATLLAGVSDMMRKRNRTALGGF